MSELKFVCPSCGQLMQCEKAYVGHEIPCPTCSAPLRIPLSDSPGGTPDAPPRAQLVLSALTEKEPLAASGLLPVAPEKSAEASEIPKEIVVSRDREARQSPLDEPANPGISCICPVCQSELRVAGDSAVQSTPKMAEVVRRGAVQTEPAPGATSRTPPDSSSQMPAQSVIEREKQIAAARAAHPIGLYPSIKPRLSYILSGGQRPVENEPAGNPAAKPESKEGEKGPGPEKSLSE